MTYAFLRFPGFRDKAVTLSYDDGVPADERLIEILSANGIKGTFNLNSSRLKDIPWAQKTYLDTGNEIAVHGVRHLPLAEVASPNAIADVINDRLALEAAFGVLVDGMAYADASYDLQVTKLLKACGIVYARTTDATHKFDLPENWLTLHPTCHHNDPALMELAKQFVETEPHWHYLVNTPKMFYLWGHAYEFNDNNNWHVIEEFASYIGNREDIWYATNGEIYRYVKAANSLVHSAAGDRVYNPTVTDIYLKYFGVEQMVPAGQTVELKRGW